MSGGRGLVCWGMGLAASGMEDVDVLIAGGGPAGLSVAWAVACEVPGARVLVVHRDAEIGLPVRTSGGSWAVRLRELGVPERLWHPLRTLVFAGPRGESRTEFGADHPVVLDVTGTYRYLAEMARGAGARVVTGAAVTGVRREVGGCVATIVDGAGERELRARFVVDATGVARTVLPMLTRERRFARLGVGAEYEFVDESPERSAAVLFVGRRFAPAGYGWVFPAPHGRVRVGVGVIKPDVEAAPRALLDEFLASDQSARFGLRLGAMTGKHFGVIPAADAPVTCVHEGVLAVGDSACQALPLVGEGIRYCIESGREAGRALAGAMLEPEREREHLESYGAWWSGRYRDRFEHAQRANRAMSGFTDRQWDVAAGFLASLSGDDLAAALRMELGATGWLRAAVRRPISVIRFLAGCKTSP